MGIFVFLVLVGIANIAALTYNISTGHIAGSVISAIAVGWVGGTISTVVVTSLKNRG